MYQYFLAPQLKSMNDYETVFDTEISNCFINEI